VRTRGRAGPSGGRRERERLSSFSDEIRCSISGVVGAVIAEDRLLFPPPLPPTSPFAAATSPFTIPPSLHSRPPPIRRPCPYRFTLAPKCPLRKPSSPPSKNLHSPHSLTFSPTTSMHRPPQCRESSAGSLSSVCHRPRKRAVHLRERDREESLFVDDQPGYAAGRCR